MNYQNQVSNHPSFGKICTVQQEKGKVLFKANMRTRWAQKGRLFIHGLLKADGILPVYEIELASEQMKTPSNIE